MSLPVILEYKEINNYIIKDIANIIREYARTCDLETMQYGETLSFGYSHLYKEYSSLFFHNVELLSSFETRKLDKGFQSFPLPPVNMVKLPEGTKFDCICISKGTGSRGRTEVWMLNKHGQELVPVYFNLITQ
jgi:hypothetical protein